jgi:hypothetical protein
MNAEDGFFWKRFTIRKKGHFIGYLTRQKAEAKLSGKNPLREKDFQI